MSAKLHHWGHTKLHISLLRRTQGINWPHFWNLSQCGKLSEIKPPLDVIKQSSFCGCAVCVAVLYNKRSTDYDVWTWPTYSPYLLPLESRISSRQVVLHLAKNFQSLENKTWEISISNLFSKETSNELVTFFHEFLIYLSTIFFNEIEYYYLHLQYIPNKK